MPLALVHWTAIIRADLVTNSRLAERGRTLGLDACVICDPGTTTVSDGMLATTLEAVIAAVYVDSGNDNNTLVAVMEKLKFFDHPFLPVTFCKPPILCLPNKQMSTCAQRIDTG